MPLNFPAVWLKRVETLLKKGDRAPWLDGIAEIDAPVVVFGEGEGEENLIYIPTTDFEPDVLVDNTNYPLAIVDYTDDSVIVKLKKFQTLATRISEDAIIGASYDKIDAATQGHTYAILKKKYGIAIHSLAPAAHTVNTPVLVSTGRTGRFKNDGTEIILKVGTRLRMTFLDLVDFKAACVAAGIDFDLNMVRLVLCDDHLLDLSADKDNFEALVSYKTGDPAPVILGFKIYTYSNCPAYNGTDKLAFGSIPDAGDGEYQASVAFYEGNVAKKTGLTRQYFDKPTTTNQANMLNYRHYYMVVPKRLRYIAAITSGTYVPAV